MVTEVLGHSVSSIFKGHTVQEECHYSWTAFWLYTQLLLGGVWGGRGGDEPVNPLNPELNPICYLLALLGAHHFLHVNRIRVKSLTFRLLMSYIYAAPILDVSRSHITTQHSQ